MYRYYITRKTPQDVLDVPPMPIPAVTGHYGQNGASFDSVRETIYGFVEYENELPAGSVAEYGLIPGPSPVYYPINEDAARRAHEMMSFRDYRPGSKTAEYRRMVDEVSLIAYRKKQSISPIYHEKIDRMAENYARRMADNMNADSRIGCMCPSILVAGGSNFPVRKKEKQNAAAERNMEEWKEIQGTIGKIKSVGTGGISSDDPNALEMLRDKLDRLEKLQERMKAANAAIRLKDQAKGDAKLEALGYSQEDIKQLREPDFCGRVGYPSYALTNNNAKIKATRDRIAELEKRQNEPAPEGWEFDGGQVVINTELNRLQIVLEGRPDDELKQTLKGYGFRWSPKNVCWQRQLTDNAIRAAKAITGKE